MTIACAITVVLCAGCGPDYAPTPESTVSPHTAVPLSPKAGAAILVRAKTWFGMLESGRVDRSQMSRHLDTTLSNDKVRQLAGQLHALGEPKSFTLVERGSYNGSNFYRFRVGLAHSTLFFTFAVDAHQKVSGLLIGSS